MKQNKKNIIKKKSVTVNNYWNFEQKEKTNIFFYFVKIIITLLNKYIFSFFKIKIINTNNQKIREELSYPCEDLTKIRNEALTDFLFDFFSNKDIKISKKIISNYISEFDNIFTNMVNENIFSNLNDSTGYNNSLIIFILTKIAKAETVIESGLWKGVSSYIIEKATNEKAKHYYFDINLSNLEYRSKKGEYFESDITFVNPKIHGNSIAFFDDHVSHYERLKYSYQNNIDIIVMDDDVSILNVHSDGWPPLPSLDMIYNYENIPHKFSWILNNKRAKADISNLDVNKYISNFEYHKFPDLSNITGYKNTSFASFLIRKK